MGTKEDFMRQAVELSRQQLDKTGCAPFAALVVKDGVVIGKGYNQVIFKNDPTSHGEVEALRDAAQNIGSWDLSGCELYTTCEPCELCVAAIHWARISKVYYANTLADCAPMRLNLAVLRKDVRSDIHERSTPAEQVLHDEAYQVLQDWFASGKAQSF